MVLVHYAKNMEPLWTRHKCRLQWQRSQSGKPLHWLFLPGGPGLGSEVLLPLTSMLDLPGTIWHLDLPGDGSNTAGKIQHWPEALVEAVSAMENVILVGHSHGGMFALATPEIAAHLRGIVLMSAAPDMAWQLQFAEAIRNTPLPEAEKCAKAYRENPSDLTLKNFIQAAAPRMFTKKGLEKGLKSMEYLPYRCKADQWTEKNFDPVYQAKWFPEKIPALILSGSEDLATPLEHFSKRPEYHRPNIILKEIKGAGHFPWIEKPEEVKAAFTDYVQKL
jgi:pimeloyl-ACP methyl ester carboxylesterase